MDICLQYVVQKQAHPEQFRAVYDVVGNKAVVDAVANLENTAYVSLTLPLINIDEDVFPEIENWFINYEDSNYWGEREIFNWDIEDLIAAIKAAIAEPEALEINSDFPRLHKSFDELNKAGEIEAYKERLTNLLAQLEPLTEINEFMIMRHDVYD